MRIEKCQECEIMTEENNGRWLILATKRKGFDWIFLCIQCVRAWRKRGLKYEDMSDAKIEVQLNKEYPLK